MSKFKNYGLLVSILSTLSLIFVDYLPDNFETITNSILATLSIAGVISNPKQGKWYIDKEGDK